MSPSQEQQRFPLLDSAAARLVKISTGVSYDISHFSFPGLHIFCAFWMKLDFAENPETLFPPPQTRFLPAAQRLSLTEVFLHS